jgi:hypothetical protein
MKEANKMRVLCIALTMVMLTAVFTAIAAPTTVIAQGEKPISALEKIQADYGVGRLTINERILYKTWAVFDPDKLSDTEYSIPPEEVHIRKSGTPMILEILENWNKLSAETQDILRCSILLRPDDASGCEGYIDPLDDTIDSTHFRVHYNITGPHAVTTAYAQNMSSYFETSYNTEVNTLGYLAPPSDLAAPNNGGDARYDVYIYDLGSGLYGYTCPEQHPITPSYSYIAVNRDYSWAPSNDDPEGAAIGAAKVTAAHEFHHAIQFAYDVTEETWWMETTSTYMEDEVYPSVNDNYNYLDNWFDVCDTQGLETFNGAHEYGNFIFAKRLSEDFGDDIIRDIWIEDQTTDGLTAIDNVLSIKGSNIVKEFNNFTKANLFLEDMYVDGGDYRTALTGTTIFDGVYLEYQYNEATDGLPFTIDGTNVNRNSWMGRWAADYITIQMSGATPGYKITFDGLDTTTNYDVSLAKKAGGVITQQDFVLDANKNGTMSLPYDASYTDIVLIIRNSGDTDTTDPSWRVIIEEATQIAYLHSSWGMQTMTDEISELTSREPGKYEFTWYDETNIDDLWSNLNNYRIFLIDEDTFYTDGSWSEFGGPIYDSFSNHASLLKSWVENGGAIFTSGESDLYLMGQEEDPQGVWWDFLPEGMQVKSYDPELPYPVYILYDPGLYSYPNSLSDSYVSGGHPHSWFTAWDSGYAPTLKRTDNNLPIELYGVFGKGCIVVTEAEVEASWAWEYLQNQLNFIVPSTSYTMNILSPQPGQTLYIGQQVTIKVAIKDDAGNPVSGATVTATSPTGAAIPLPEIVHSPGTGIYEGTYTILSSDPIGDWVIAIVASVGGEFPKGSVPTEITETRPPIADAGPDQTVYVIPPATMAMVTLDGSGSYDPDGDPLTYNWTWGGNAAHGVKPTIELPLGTTTITLVVNDGKVDSEPDSVDVTIEITPAVPTMVPTMDKWGIVAMIALFAGLLVWMVRRRLLAS